MGRSFNGTTQYLRHLGRVADGWPVTYSCWAYTTDNASDQMLVSENNASNGVDGFKLYFGGSVAGDPVIAELVGSGTDPAAETTTGFSTSTWHHAAGVFVSSSDVRAYIDGGSKGTDSGSGTMLPSRASLGARDAGFGPDAYLTGRLAEVGIWSIALNDAEIALLALGYSPLLVRPEYLKGYWPLWGNNGPEPELIEGEEMELINNPSSIEHPTTAIIYPSKTVAVAPDMGGMISV